MTTKDLREEYAEFFGDPTTAEEPALTEADLTERRAAGQVGTPTAS